jgi:uncharacterized protein
MKIPILHLEDGLHKFNFQVKAKTLDFRGNEVYPENLDINVDVNKFDKNIQCEIDIQTKVYYTCDRCLEGFSKSYHEKFRLLFHIGTNDFETDEEDVVLLPSETLEIDLTERLIEYLVLTIPMKNLCKTDCKGICPGCGADLNHEACHCDQAVTDPRWEELRKLLK